MTRVMLADDHPIVLSGIRSILRHTPYEVVAVANDGNALLEALPAARPEMLVLDVQMPRRSGIEVVRALRARGDFRPIVLLTASLDDNGLVEAVDLGVNGIVLKDGAEQLLVRCLDEVSRGGRFIDETLLRRAEEAKREGAGKDKLASLSPRERAVVALVVRGLRNREIATELGITEGSVKVYLHRIYDKLGVTNRTELAMRARDGVR